MIFTPTKVMVVFCWALFVALFCWASCILRGRGSKNALGRGSKSPGGGVPKAPSAGFQKRGEEQPSRQAAGFQIHAAGVPLSDCGVPIFLSSELEHPARCSKKMEHPKKQDGTPRFSWFRFLLRCSDFALFRNSETPRSVAVQLTRLGAPRLPGGPSPNGRRLRHGLDTHHCPQTAGDGPPRPAAPPCSCSKPPRICS